jgi:CheY-like chemotaxis protein
MACSILYIEDTPEDVRLLEEAIQSAGVKVELTSASTAREAIDAASSGQAVDAIILDWNLPELSGSELLGAIREYRPSTPVFVFTGAPVTVTLDEVRDHVETVLAKPFTLEAWESFAKLLSNFCEDLLALPSPSANPGT